MLIKSLSVTDGLKIIIVGLSGNLQVMRGDMLNSLPAGKDISEKRIFITVGEGGGVTYIKRESSDAHLKNLMRQSTNQPLLKFCGNIYT